jgi:putative ATPase
MKEIGYGKEYAYAHDFPGNFVDLEYLPDEISGKTLYKPQNNSREKADRERLLSLWKQRYDY